MKVLDVTASLDSMTDVELVAYHNILTMQGVTLNVDPDGKGNSHRWIVRLLLDKRGIPHQSGKLINKVLRKK